MNTFTHRTPAEVQAYWERREKSEAERKQRLREKVEAMAKSGYRADDEDMRSDVAAFVDSVVLCHEQGVDEEARRLVVRVIGEDAMRAFEDERQAQLDAIEYAAMERFESGEDLDGFFYHSPDMTIEDGVCEFSDGAVIVAAGAPEDTPPTAPEPAPAPVRGIEAAVAAARAEDIPEHIIRAGRMFYRRKNRLDNVPGEFDSKGRFYADERTPSVRQARTPSKAWPYSQMTAARTAAHCASVCRVADEHLLIVKRIALSAERGDDIAAARHFVGAPWRKFVREEARRLRAEAEREQEEVYRTLDAYNPARIAARAQAHAVAAE